MAYICIHDDFVLQHNQSVLYTVSHQSYAHKPNLQAATSEGSLQAEGTLMESYPTQNNTQPIRFYLDTTYLDEDFGFSCFSAGDVVDVNGANYTCTADDVLSAEREEYVRRTLLPDARNKLTSLFRVMPVDGPLFLQPGRCGFQGGVPIPESYTRLGVGLFDTDLVVFVTSRPVQTAHVLAFAGQCQEDQIGRSITGHLNLNPSEVDVTPYAHEGQLGIILHELTHVLGFSFGKFDNFHVQYPRSSTGYSYETSQALAHDQTENIAVINTPRVLAWVNDHYGCTTLTGAALENGGGSGTRLSHWEKRTFMNEYMTGESTHNPVLTGLTLSLFEDSGWYMVNYSAADKLVWGKGQGCDFVQKSCAGWPKDGGYYCSDSQISCSFDMQAKGSCNIDSFNDALPLGNQYFANAKRGGGDNLADYCPYIRSEDDWCYDESNMDIPTLIDSGETYCKECKCFSTSLVKEFPFGGSRRLGCYRAECAGVSDMRVKLGNIWYTCTPNASISVEGYGGHIYCPPQAQIQAVCANTEYAMWPTVLSVAPAFGGPGTLVTITGTGFSENITSVFIHEECSNITIVNATQIVAMLPTWEKLGNPAHIVAESASVVVMDKDGRTGLGSGLFSIRAGDDPMFYIHAMVWMIEHWLAFVAIFGAVGAAFFVRAARKKEFQYKLQRGTSFVQSDDL